MPASTMLLTSDAARIMIGGAGSAAIGWGEGGAGRCSGGVPTSATAVRSG
jgi:hypothetical protein